VKIKRMELESEKSVDSQSGETGKNPKKLKKQKKVKAKMEKGKKNNQVNIEQGLVDVLLVDGENSPEAGNLYDFENPKKKRSKKVYVAVLVLLVFVSTVGVVIYFVKFKNATGSTAETTTDFGNMTMGANTVSATGTTAVGMDTEEFEPDYITTELYIEEVYLSTGDEIEANTPILKISDDSITDARAELTAAATDATLAYRAGLIEHEQSKITAKYDYDVSVLTGQQAEDVYNATLASLDSTLADAKQQVTDAEDQIAEYTTALETDSYKEDYQVEEKLAAYNTNLALLQSKVAEWNIPYSAFMSSGASMGGGGSTYDKWEVTTLNLLYAELAENETEYEKAQDDYDNAVAEAKLQLAQLNLSIETLKENLVQAQADYDTNKTQALTTYNTSLAKSKMAKDDYDTAIKKADETFSTLEATKTEADDNLTEFESLLGDGKLYTTNGGTILRVNVAAEDYLQGASMVLAYSNTDAITVAVSVAQADISKISIGDTANVIISGYGSYTGTVAEINPVSSSTSRTSITYDVTVTLDNTDSTLTSNLTAEVYFNVGGQTE